MTITLNDGEVDLIIQIIGDSLPEDADKATNPIECNLLDRLIELRQTSWCNTKRGHVHVYDKGVCMFCQGLESSHTPKHEPRDVLPFEGDGGSAGPKDGG